MLSVDRELCLAIVREVQIHEVLGRGACRVGVLRHDHLPDILRHEPALHDERVGSHAPAAAVVRAKNCDRYPTASLDHPVPALQDGRRSSRALAANVTFVDDDARRQPNVAGLIVRPERVSVGVAARRLRAAVRALASSQGIVVDCDTRTGPRLRHVIEVVGRHRSVHSVLHRETTFPPLQGKVHLDLPRSKLRLLRTALLRRGDLEQIQLRLRQNIVRLGVILADHLLVKVEQVRAIHVVLLLPGTLLPWVSKPFDLVETTTLKMTTG